MRISNKCQIFVKGSYAEQKATQAMKQLLSEKQIKSFNNEGFLIIKNFYDIKRITKIQEKVYTIIGELMDEQRVNDNRERFNGNNFDQHFNKLIELNRSWGGIVYDAVKQIPAFVNLVSDPIHEEIFSSLRHNSAPGLAGGGYGMRINNPFEDQYRAFWHQEYPAQLRSQDGLVFWSPLVPVTEDMGPVHILRRSHVEGPLSIYNCDENDVGRVGAYLLRLHDEQKYIDKYPCIAPLTNPGDLIIMDFFLVHSSGYNRSTRSLWSMQFRYFNYSEPQGKKNAWIGSFSQGVDFRSIHPELSY